MVKPFSLTGKSMNNLRKFQCRDERDGTFGVIYHDDFRHVIFAAPETYNTWVEAAELADAYEANAPDVKDWILVGRS